VASLELNARKSLGQNFLFDLNLTRRIAREAGPFGDSVVIEIGPGPGGLTRALLAEGARHVIAIERDDRCLPALEQVGSAWPGQLTVISGDALDVDEQEFLGGKPAFVVANLPYNIASALLVKWLTSSKWPSWYSGLTLMFQREVAERIVAEPSTPAYGRLSILSQWRTSPRMLFDVHRSAFTPPPKITSTVVRFDLLPQPRGEADIAILSRVTAAAFGQRRKMLRSSLKSLGPFSDALLEEARILPTARAEEIPVEGFAALARALASRLPASSHDEGSHEA
jgi:16S rRNA (adenine1518-N6/adenine1519-N6)-dimethyltransferase